MADAPLPTEERVRELTADPDLSPGDANRYAALFADAGKYAQALMFYSLTKDADGLLRIKEKAVDQGDAFLLVGIDRLAPGLVSPQEWVRAGDRARAAGKFLFARDCYARAGDEEKAAATHEEWLKIFTV